MISASTISDRMCIKSNGKYNLNVSIDNKDKYCDLCELNSTRNKYEESVKKFFKFWKYNGILIRKIENDFLFTGLINPKIFNKHYKTCDNTLYQYFYKKCPKINKILNLKINREFYVKNYASDVYRVIGEQNMKKEIVQNGSIVSVLNLYQDLLNYKYEF